MRRVWTGNPWPAVPAVALVLLLPAAAAAADTGTAPGTAATPAPSAAAPGAKPAPTPPQNLEPMGPQAALPLLGQKIWGPAGEDMGLVVNVLVDNDGHPVAAVIDFGGFLGVGTRKIAIDWRLLHFKPANSKITVQLSLSRAELQAAPEYKPASKPNQPADVVGPPPAARSATALPNGGK
jgi:hypothetical protein